MTRYVCNNPAVLQRADPWIYRHSDGSYYFTASVPEYDRIEIRRSRHIGNLGGAAGTVIWNRHEDGEMSHLIWAPELHFLQRKWYVYFAAADSPGPVNGLFNHRIYVLENSDPDPLSGVWAEKGKILTPWDTFSLDATVFSLRGNQYLVWAQKEPDIPGNSNLYISRMKNPWTLEGKTLRLSIPEYPWETRGYLVNEGPAVLIRNGRVFITYSCSATDASYCMGMLSAREGADLLDSRSWEKSPRPVMETSASGGQFGPGHNSFTRSEEGNLDLLVYHARNYREIQGDPLSDPNRHTRIQPFSWSPEGSPVFQDPVPDGPLFR